MNLKIIVYLLFLSPWVYTQSNIQIKNITFLEKTFITDTAQYLVGVEENLNELIRPMAEGLYEAFNMPKEKLATIDNYLDSINNNPIELKDNKITFTFEVLNDSIIKRYESSPEHKYALGPSFVNFKSKKVYGS